MFIISWHWLIFVLISFFVTVFSRINISGADDTRCNLYTRFDVWLKTGCVHSSGDLANSCELLSRPAGTSWYRSTTSRDCHLLTKDCHYQYQQVDFKKIKNNKLLLTFHHSNIFFHFFFVSFHCFSTNDAICHHNNLSFVLITKNNRARWFRIE